MSARTLGKILKAHQLRITNPRKEVLLMFLEAGHTALTSQNIESQISHLDRVTLYRILKSFEDAGLIHQVLDGTGKSKYAFCRHDCSIDRHMDQHAHFHCRNCEKTICLETEIPKIKLKDSYQLESAFLVLQGLCEDCLADG